MQQLQAYQLKLLVLSSETGMKLAYWVITMDIDIVHKYI